MRGELDAGVPPTLINGVDVGATLEVGRHTHIASSGDRAATDVIGSAHSGSGSKARVSVVASEKPMTITEGRMNEKGLFVTRSLKQC